MTRHELIGRKGGSAPHSRRTHWTPGKPRNPRTEPRRVVIAAVRRLVRHQAATDAARRIGVQRKTVWRWGKGIDYPSPKHLSALLRAVSRLGGKSEPAAKSPANPSTSL